MMMDTTFQRYLAHQGPLYRFSVELAPPPINLGFQKSTLLIQMDRVKIYCQYLKVSFHSQSPFLKCRNSDKSLWIPKTFTLRRMNRRKTATPAAVKRGYHGVHLPANPRRCFKPFSIIPNLLFLSEKYSGALPRRRSTPAL